MLNRGNLKKLKSSRGLEKGGSRNGIKRGNIDKFTRMKRFLAASRPTKLKMASPTYGQAESEVEKVPRIIEQLRKSNSTDISSLTATRKVDSIASISLDRH